MLQFKDHTAAAFERQGQSVKYLGIDQTGNYTKAAEESESIYILRVYQLYDHIREARLVAQSNDREALVAYMCEDQSLESCKAICGELRLDWEELEHLFTK